MKTIDSTLFHRVLPPEHGGPGPHPALVLLHGRGTDEEDLLGLATEFDERLFVISVRAPFPYEFGGYTWYDAGQIGQPDTVKFPESAARLTRFLEDVRTQYPVRPDRLFLFGFSMGSVMALAMGLTRPEHIRGVSANSGYVPEGTALEFRWKELQNTAFHVTHGMMDPVVPIILAHRARMLFGQSNAPFIYREYPAEHYLTDACIVETDAWLKGLIDGQ